MSDEKLITSDLDFSTTFITSAAVKPVFSNNLGEKKTYVFLIIKIFIF